MAEKPQPVRVLYCGVCSLPPEYCEFGSDFEKCKPWLIQNVPDLYPNLLKGTFAFFLSQKKFNIPQFTRFYLFIYFDHSDLIQMRILLLFRAEANDKESDKVADKLQSTGISSGTGDGAASSGIFLFNFCLVCLRLKKVEIP